MRNLHTVFYNGCTNLHSHQQCRSPSTVHKYSLSPLLCQHFWFLPFLKIVIPAGVRWCLIVVLICISLMISDVEHFLCTCWPPSLEKCLFRTFAHFKIRFFFLRYMSFLHILVINPLSDIWLANIFSNPVGCLFSSLIFFLCDAEVFQFGIVLFVYFCFCWLYFWCHIQKVITKTKVKEHFPCVFF